MLNFTPATVTPDSTAVGVDAAQAARRPLAGFGAGAFACGGIQVGSRVTEMAAAPALRRIRRVFAAISLGQAHPGGRVSAAYESGRVSTKQLNQLTRLIPVTPGGVGPYPARKPDPV